MTEKGLDEKKLAATIRTAVRMLDNVIDINFYPTAEAQNSNSRHRPIGIGIMGFQDALYIQNISYASHEAVEFADKSMEMISYYAIFASTELAKERGTYSTYKGSKWDRGFLPIDTIDLLEKERGGDLEVDRTTSMDWTPVRDCDQKTWHAQQQHDGDCPDCDDLQYHRQSPNRSNRCTNICLSNRISRESSPSPTSTSSKN